MSVSMYAERPVVADLGHSCDEKICGIEPYSY